mgnify:CR=1
MKSNVLQSFASIHIHLYTYTLDKQKKRAILYNVTAGTVAKRISTGISTPAKVAQRHALL